MSNDERTIIACILAFIVILSPIGALFINNNLKLGKYKTTCLKRSIGPGAVMIFLLFLDIAAATQSSRDPLDLFSVIVWSSSVIVLPIVSVILGSHALGWLYWFISGRKRLVATEEQKQRLLIDIERGVQPKVPSTFAKWW